MKITSIHQIIFAGFFLFLLLGISSSSLANSKIGDQNTMEPVQFLIPEIPKKLDVRIIRTPTIYIIVDHLTSTLITKNKEGDITGELARRWYVSDDFKQYDFELKPSKWSDGSQITVEDIMFHFEKSSEVGKAVHVDFSNIRSIKKTGAFSFRIDLIKVDANFLLKLANPETGILHKTYIDSGNLSVTSGPYFLEGRTNSTLLLTKNNHFLGHVEDSPNRVEFVDLERARFFEHLKSRKIDFSWIPNKITYEEHLSVLKDGFLKSFAPNNFFVHFVSLNVNSKVFADKDLRKLIQLAVANGVTDADKKPGWEIADQLYLPTSPGRADDFWIKKFFDQIRSPKKMVNQPTLRVAGLESRPLFGMVVSAIEKMGIKVTRLSAHTSGEFVALMKDPHSYDVAVQRIDISSLNLLENLLVAFNEVSPYIILSSKSSIKDYMRDIQKTSTLQDRYPLFKKIGEELLSNGHIAPMYHESMLFYINSNRLDISGLSTSYPDIRFWRVKLVK